MAIRDFFSKRQKRNNEEVPDVYIYNELPRTLKNKIHQIILRAAGRDRTEKFPQVDRLFSDIYHELCHEYGEFSLGENRPTYKDKLFTFFEKEKSIERCLDVIELSFFHIQKKELDPFYNGSVLKDIRFQDAISELNDRFKEYNVGYRFESGQIIRIENEIIHKEAIKPALALLHDPVFAGANEEFLKAHEHYRHKRYKECIADCCKAFESTLKIICQINGWDIKPKDGASRLIDKCIKNGLLPSYLETQFTSVKSVLESGIPTIRNNTSGHGQGSERIEVPEWLTQYVLNLTATSIVFLIQAHKNFTQKNTSDV
ncbi:STM4504/CBY_0614 family protein [Zymomonas mobilis]|uniref:Abortive infection protein-like C-terminal domain-containing protein n=1 Tax=Zymomonas mobilis subsp. mobilis (strain ATCC 31821 / ZM4 / CP4) TaxID=264203 RepID=A0A806CIM2_ZYMMO|nr:hypothetical protein [Zymomonas mobilis]ADC33827.1 conserved hypothetical protein [Zymomonas mobilis subsp. mobilis ZM4 = ATCC 31821]AHB11048.1 Abortive infection C-terminus [Zymomonas mobilis subsp. mobilis str. CP4 = NRRL B-14023]AHJ71414.1 hypothetical protein A254_01829 [Zymomonas mobilis subsp. mobilis NRRL B-12526]AHJ73305.1 hypothetical protein A265_01865 [Zymomonas mobilis subsp. mobilis str. CP4 = NRRL B-14023]